jgi:O-antigen ligase
MAVVFFMMLLGSPLRGGLLQEKCALPQGIRRFVLYLAPVIIFLNLTRGDWLGFLVGVGIFLFLGRRLINLSRKMGAIGLTLILIAVMSISLPVLIPKGLLESRIKNPATVYGRLATWEIVLSEAFKHPVFGIGLNNTRDLLAQERAWLEGSGSNTTAHNSFLTIFTELGTVGLLAYLALVVSMIRTGLSLYRRGGHLRDQWRGIAVIAIMVSYLVPALFGNTLHLTGISHMYVYVFVGGIASLYCRHQPASDLSPSYISYPRRIITNVSAVIR